MSTAKKILPRLTISLQLFNNRKAQSKMLIILTKESDGTLSLQRYERGNTGLYKFFRHMSPSPVLFFVFPYYKFNFSSTKFNFN